MEQITAINTRIEKLEENNVNLVSKYTNLVDENKTLKQNIIDIEQSLQFTQDELIDKKVDDLYYELNGGIEQLFKLCGDLKEKKQEIGGQITTEQSQNRWYYGK